MTEDDIRTKVVYPWLVSCGLSPAEVSVEFSFEIRLGRTVHRVGSQSKTPRPGQISETDVIARPRADVLVRRGQTNLMIVEVKAPDEAVDHAARDQGISYARLLPQIAPFVVVTNGKTTAVFDSITREELSGGMIPADHPGLRGGFRLSINELQLRTEALEMFVSLSTENLLVFCAKQLEFRMRRLRDTNPASGKKYIPSLYVDRKKPRESIEKLLDVDHVRAVAVVGRPQVGKTNFLCRFAEERVHAGCPVLFYPAISLTSGLLQEIAEDFGWFLGDQNPVALLTSNLGKILRRTGSRLALIIDGWNEADIKVARIIDRECERVCSGNGSIQLVVSFTHSAAKKLLVHAGNPSYLAEAAGIGLHGFEIIESDPAAAARQSGWSAVVIDPYDQFEQKEAYQILRQHFNVTVPDSHRRTTDPYLLGIAMRHFAGRSLPDSMDEPELLCAWLEARIARSVSDNFDIRAALTGLGAAMIADGSPLPERKAKQCWGLAALAPVPPALSELALLACLVVHFTNNVVVSGFLPVRQRKLLKSAATHVLANPSNPVE
jgi:Type I restriction enzyme R protein N terminus (HSDR_N)